MPANIYEFILFSTFQNTHKLLITGNRLIVLNNVCFLDVYKNIIVQTLKNKMPSNTLNWP